MAAIPAHTSNGAVLCGRFSLKWLDSRGKDASETAPPGRDVWLAADFDFEEVWEAADYPWPVRLKALPLAQVVISK